MALDPAVLDALLASGATAEMIVAAVKADAEKVREHRSKEAVRKAKQRAELKGTQVPQSPAKSQGLDGTSGDFSGHDGTSPSLAKEGPHTPKKTQPSQTSLRSEDQTREAAFAEFKAAYPKKPGAPWQAAREKFYRLVRDGEDAASIIGGAKAFAASKIGEDPQFICAPTVFLNQRRWLDEHEPAGQRQHAPPRAGPAQRPAKPSVVAAWTEDIFTDEQRHNASAETRRPALAYRG